MTIASNHPGEFVSLFLVAPPGCSGSKANCALGVVLPAQHRPIRPSAPAAFFSCRWRALSECCKRQFRLLLPKHRQLVYLSKPTITVGAVPKTC